MYLKKELNYKTTEIVHLHNIIPSIVLSNIKNKKVL